MGHISRLVVLAACVALAACVGAKTRAINEHGAYKEYLGTVKEMDNAWAEAVKSITSTEDKCEDDACRVSKSFAAAMVLQNRPLHGSQVQPFKHEPTTGEKVLLSLTNQAGALLGTAVNGAVAINSTNKNADVSMRDSDNRAAQAIAGFGAIRDTAQAGLARPTTEYNVGGNFGDTYGDDYTGGDRTDQQVGPGGVIGEGNLVANGDNGFNSGHIGDAADDHSIGDCSAGAGGNGGTGAAGTGASGGSGGAGGNGAAGAPGTGGAGGVGGAGGDAGGCSTGRVP